MAASKFVGLTDAMVKSAQKGLRGASVVRTRVTVEATVGLIIADDPEAQRKVEKITVEVERVDGGFKIYGGPIKRYFIVPTFLEIPGAVLTYVLKQGVG